MDHLTTNKKSSADSTIHPLVKPEGTNKDQEK
jgi:hypothetical protein